VESKNGAANTGIMKGHHTAPFADTLGVSGDKLYGQGVSWTTPTWTVPANFLYTMVLQKGEGTNSTNSAKTVLAKMGADDKLVAIQHAVTGAILDGENITSAFRDGFGYTLDVFNTGSKIVNGVITGTKVDGVQGLENIKFVLTSAAGKPPVVTAVAQISNLPTQGAKYDLWITSVSGKSNAAVPAKIAITTAKYNPVINLSVGKKSADTIIVSGKTATTNGIGGLGTWQQPTAANVLSGATYEHNDYRIYLKATINKIAYRIEVAATFDTLGKATFTTEAITDALKLMVAQEQARVDAMPGLIVASGGTAQDKAKTAADKALKTFITNNSTNGVLGFKSTLAYSFALVAFNGDVESADANFTVPKTFSTMATRDW
jgi:hypothetical protein